MSARDDLADLIEGASYEWAAGFSLAADIPPDADAIADAILAAGWRPPARVIETEEELEALPVGTVLVEGDHATPDEVVPGGLMTMPGVFHRFHEGWHVVAGHGARPVPLPATVLWEPGDDDE